MRYPLDPVGVVAADGVAGGRDELHGLGRGTVLPQRRRDHQLDQGRRTAEGSGAGPQHRRAAGLEHLGGDVDRHVRPGLEHGADHPDRYPPLEHPLAGGQRADEALQGRFGGVGEHLELDGHVGEPLGSEPEAVEQAAGRAWLADTIAGRDALVVVGSNAAAARLSNQLRGELVRYGIDVLLIVPGLTRTSLDRNLLHTNGRMQVDFSKGMDPEYVARRILAALRANRAETVLGTETRWVLFAQRYFPRLLEWGLQRFVRRQYAGPPNP